MALQSLSFNGLGAYVSCGNVPTGGLSAITIEVWVYFTNLLFPTKGIISKDGATSQDWAIFTSNNTDITFRFTNNSGVTKLATFTNGAKSGRWQHIVGVYNGSSVKIYVDGVLGNISDSATGTTKTSSQNVEIGRYSGSRYLNGKVCYASISNSVRYNSNFTPPSLPRSVDANTVAQWNFARIRVSGPFEYLKNVCYNTLYDGVMTGAYWGSDTAFFRTHIDSAHLLELKINGVDLWPNVVSKSFRLTENEGGQTSTLSFSIEETSSTYTFLAWAHEVVWLVDGIKEFGGYVVSVSPKVVKGTTRKVYSISCESYQSILNRAPKLRESYINTNSGNILAALFTAAGMTQFNTSTYVSPGTIWEEFSCNGEKLVDLIDRLAQRENYTWRIDPEKNVRFLHKNSVVAQFDVAEIGTADLASSFPVNESPEYKYDQTDIRNRIKIIGGTRVSPIIIDTFTGDDYTLLFQLSHRPIYDVLYVTVNEALQRHGVDWYVTFDDGYDCLINYRSGTIRWNPNTPPPDLAEIVVCYRQLVEFNHSCTSSGSYSQYGMWFDYEIADPNITSEYMATQICAAMLSDYEYGRFEGTFTIERYGLHAMERISVNFPSLGINAYYTIRQVSTEVIKGSILSSQIKYGEKRPRVSDIVYPSINTGGPMGGAVPIQSGGGQGGGLVPGSSWGGGEVDVIRVNNSVQAVKRTTLFTSASDYGNATGIVLSYDNATDSAKLLGLNNGELQAYFDSEGRIKGGAGSVIIDESGLRVVAPNTYPSAAQKIRFGDESGTKTYAEWYTFMNLASIDAWFTVDAVDHPVDAHAVLNVQAISGPGKYGNILIDAIGDNYAEHATINMVADVGDTLIELMAGNVQVSSGASFDKGITVNATNADSDTRVLGDTATNLLVVDAGLDAVMIGTTLPGVIADFRATGIAFNQNNGDIDVKMAGTTDNSLIYVDASTDRVGIGTNAPTGKLQVIGETRVGDVSDYVKIDTAGHLTMNGDATQWGSVYISPFSMYRYSSDPILDMFPLSGAINLWGYIFPAGVMSELYFFAEVPKSYKHESGIKPIIHFSPYQTCGFGEKCIFGIEYIYANHRSVFSSNDTIWSDVFDPIEDLEMDKHYRMELSSILSGDGESDAIIVGRVFRDGANDTATQSMILLGLEFLFEMDTLGWKTSITKT